MAPNMFWAEATRQPKMAGCSLTPSQRCSVVVGITLLLTIAVYLTVLFELKSAAGSWPCVCPLRKCGGLDFLGLAPSRAGPCSFLRDALAGVGATLLFIVLLYVALLWRVCQRKDRAKTPWGTLRLSCPFPPCASPRCPSAVLCTLLCLTDSQFDAALVSPGPQGADAQVSVSPDDPVGSPHPHLDRGIPVDKRPGCKRYAVLGCQGFWCFFSCCSIMFVWIAGLIFLSYVHGWQQETAGYTFLGLDKDVSVGFTVSVVSLSMPVVTVCECCCLPVRVLPQVEYDPSGLAHISAQTDHDMFFTQVCSRVGVLSRALLIRSNVSVYVSVCLCVLQGVVHAQLRLWQVRVCKYVSVCVHAPNRVPVCIPGRCVETVSLVPRLQMEFQRRLGTGSLSEVIGNDTLYIDLAIRALSLVDSSQRAFDSSDNFTQEAVLAYVKVGPCLFTFPNPRGGSGVDCMNCSPHSHAGHQRVPGQ